MPNYLSKLLINESSVQAYNWHAVDLTNITSVVSADLDGLEIGVVSAEVCNQIAVMARGAGSTAILRTNNDIATLLGNGTLTALGRIQMPIVLLMTGRLIN